MMRGTKLHKKKTIINFFKRAKLITTDNDAD